MNIQSLLQLAISTGMARLDAEVLLGHVLGLDRAYLYSRSESLVSENAVLELDTLVRRRLLGEPLAYLIGQKEFWSLSFSVNPAVLIPRPETELLVELALKLLPEETYPTAKLLDLGTGSGAIAIALAKERLHWTITATDISKEALCVAKENAKNNLLHPKNPIQFYLGDWFDALASTNESASRDGSKAFEHVNHSKPLFHAIISNPPYIAENDPHLLDVGLSFEPRLALKSGNEGLEDIEKIIQSAPDYLLSKAWLLIEHGYDQSSSVLKLFEANHYSAIQQYQDLAGITRVTVGQKP